MMNIENPIRLFVLTLLGTVLITAAVLAAFLTDNVNMYMTAVSLLLLSGMMGITNYAVQRHFEQQDEK